LTGVPTVLMSALSGRVVWDPPDLDGWLQALVDTMINIHATTAPATLRAWSPYVPEGVPPVWTRHRFAWERAIAAYEGQRPPSDRVFVHRDFHPGNVLWDNDRVSGVVDWVASCAGPPEEDVAHCRVNLARHHGQPAADRFVDLWLRATGRADYDPYWDLVDVEHVQEAEQVSNQSLDAAVVVVRLVASAAAALLVIDDRYVRFQEWARQAFEVIHRAARPAVDHDERAHTRTQPHRTNPTADPFTTTYRSPSTAAR